MGPATFILRSLRFHWRNHLGVLLGATLATTILVGAMAVGDSVRHSLARQALMRLGQVHFAVNTHDRFFRAQLAEDLAAKLQAPVAPVIAMSARRTPAYALMPASGSDEISSILAATSGCVSMPTLSSWRSIWA